MQPDTIAKILFTSGSTGQPKGVINTQRMLCVNQQQLAQVWPFLERVPPVLCDWLPWNHTFGANHNFNLVLRNGGTLYIDEGKPAPGLIERTVANLREVSPNIYFNVPRGFDMLLPHLESDAGAAHRASSATSRSSSTPAPRFRKTCGSGWRPFRCASSAAKFFCTSAWGCDRDRTACNRGALSERMCRVCSASRCPVASSR